MQSTISRFACRILVDRNEPNRARIFAAGFDSSRNIFLGVSEGLRFGEHKTFQLTAEFHFGNDPDTFNEHKAEKRKISD